MIVTAPSIPILGEVVGVEALERGRGPSGVLIVVRQEQGPSTRSATLPCQPAVALVVTRKMSGSDGLPVPPWRGSRVGLLVTSALVLFTWVGTGLA